MSNAYKTTVDPDKGLLIIDLFLCTLDKLNITSSEDGDINFVETEMLFEYWCASGVFDE